MLPARELDRGRRPLRRRVPRGHVRGGGRPRPPLLPHQARLRGRGAPRVQAAVPHLPPRLRHRRQQDGLHRQDRWPVLFLQDDPEDAQPAAAVDADDRHRRRPHQHRAGRLRRRRARPHRAQEGPRRQVLPPDRSGALPNRRGAEHLRQGRPRADDDDARQRAHVRLHPGADRLRPRRPRAGQARDPGGADRPRHPARRVPVHQLADALRQPRGGEGAQGLGHRRAAARELCAEDLGLLGTQPRPGSLHRPHARGPRQGQGVRRHRRLVRHRPRDGAEARRGGRQGGDRRARPREARRGEEGDRRARRHLLHLLVRPRRHGVDRRAREEGPRRPRHRRRAGQQRRPLDTARGAELPRPLPRPASTTSSARCSSTTSAR